MQETVLGIDIGGSGIKGAPVALADGQPLGERVRIPTPPGGEPGAISDCVVRLCRHFSWTGRVGIAFPAVVSGGIVRTAANISRAWIGLDAVDRFSRATGLCCTVLNDADAAGLALMRFSAEARECPGVVLVLTIGTGIGTALFLQGRLVPNLELGHIEIDGLEAERWAADAARKRDKLSMEKWAKRLNTVLARLEALLWPDLILIGGGAAKKYDQLGPLLHSRARLLPARLGNMAGIIGAALAGQTPPSTVLRSDGPRSG